MGSRSRLLTQKVPQDFLRDFLSKRVMGIEPTCPAWKAGVLTIVLHPHDIYLIVSNKGILLVSMQIVNTLCKIFGSPERISGNPRRKFIKFVKRNIPFGHTYQFDGFSDTDNSPSQVLARKYESARYALIASSNSVASFS